MSVLQKSIAWLLMGAVAVVGTAWTAEQAIAQSTAPNADTTMGTDDDGDSMFGEGVDPFDLIHRAILSPSMTSTEYWQQQQRAITSEADAFRTLQQEALRQMQTPAVVETEASPEVLPEGDTL